MSNPKIRLFTKSWCGWCHEARRWLDTHGFEYDAIDIEVDPMAAREMQRLSGQSRVPTLEVAGHVLGDFDTRQLETFFRRIGISKNGKSPT
ncbi:MAG: glutaredoxin family protein [Verrucomicrobiae bacterium]|nr:glutaredoxin family protein [Verrucomicrobiae bacterium]